MPMRQRTPSKRATPSTRSRSAWFRAGSALNALVERPSARHDRADDRNGGTRMKLAGRKALVTGGSRGIGRAIALEFAKEGADVAVTYLSQQTQAVETAALVQDLGRRAVAFAVRRRRLRPSAASRRGGRSCPGRPGHPGAQRRSSGRLCHVAETTEAEFKAVLDVNLFGAFYLAQAILPAMRKRPRGDMLFISSSGTKHRRDIGLPYDVARSRWRSWRSSSPRPSPNGVSG